VPESTMVTPSEKAELDVASERTVVSPVESVSSIPFRLML